jgi:hypothetical protein
MNKALVAAFLFGVFVSSAQAQAKSNDTVLREIRARNASKNITVDLNTAGGTSKIMAVAENFDDGETGRAGIRAMNFALGVFYPGSEMTAAPDPVMLSFWVLTKQPRFAASHSLAIISDGTSIGLGDARYAAKPREDMEYLNFNLTRAQLSQVAAGNSVRARIGTHEFTFTAAQLKLIRDFLAVTSL